MELFQRLMATAAIATTLAALALVSPASGKQHCKVTLTGGGALTVGDHAHLVASVSGCKVPRGAYFLVTRFSVNAITGKRGRGVGRNCGIPCRIHDRRTVQGTYIYQVFLEVKGHYAGAHSAEVRVSWAERGRVFVLAPGETKVTNVQGPTMHITAGAGTGTADATPPPGGATWNSHYEWNVPTTLTAGVRQAFTISVMMSGVSPDQDNSDQININAPNFAEGVPLQYKKGDGSKKASMTFPYTLALNTVSDFTVTIGFVSCSVEYHFHHTPL